jgi:hypothetical protein
MVVSSSASESAAREMMMMMKDIAAERIDCEDCLLSTIAEDYNYDTELSLNWYTKGATQSSRRNLEVGKIQRGGEELWEGY